MYLRISLHQRDAPAEWAGRPPFMAALGMVIFILAVVLVFSPWAREAD